MKTVEEVKNIYAGITLEIKAKIKAVEDLAGALNIHISTNELHDVNSLVHEKFPELKFLKNFRLGYHPVDHTFWEIADAVNHPEYHTTQAIGFIDYNRKKNTIKIRTSESYYLGLFGDYWGFPLDSFVKVVAKYNNGTQVIELAPESFEKFLKIILHKTPITEEILNGITKEDCENFQKHLKDDKRFYRGHYINTICARFADKDDVSYDCNIYRSSVNDILIEEILLENF